MHLVAPGGGGGIGWGITAFGRTVALANRAVGEFNEQSRPSQQGQRGKPWGTGGMEQQGTLAPSRGAWHLKRIRRITMLRMLTPNYVSIVAFMGNSNSVSQAHPDQEDHDAQDAHSELCFNCCIYR